MTVLLPAQYLAQHLFHVAPPGDKIHSTGSGDTAIIWIAVGLLLAVSILATAMWSAVDRRRLQYQTLAAWLRFLIRLTVGFGLVVYGIDKVFPLQMPPPSIASLSEPMGMHSPMALLWSFIGVNPVYEMICGGAELLAGLLLLLRRTALVGAIFTAFVMSNVLLYNLCFDVPVKLYAGHLLLLALFLTLSDAGVLWRIFWLHRPAAPSGAWAPPSTRTWARRTIIGVEIGFTVLTFVAVLTETIPAWKETHARLIAVVPLQGAWRIDSATIAGPKGGVIPNPVLSEDKQAFVELDINSNERAVFQDGAGKASGFAISTDIAKHTVEFTRPDKSKITFAATRPDPTHLTLVPTGRGDEDGIHHELYTNKPTRWKPLTTRGFHWVSEFPYQK